MTMDVPEYHLQCTDTSHHDQLQVAVQSLASQEQDLFLVSQEGEQIYTQRSLLCLYSSFLTSYLRDVPCCNSTSISLPLSSLSINNLIKVLQTGIATADALEELSDVAEAALTLGIDLGDFDFGGDKNEEIETNLDESYNMVKTEPGLDQGKKKKKVRKTKPKKEKIQKQNVKQEPGADDEAESFLQDQENDGLEQFIKPPKEKTASKGPCTLCGKMFTDNYKFNRHMTTHTGEKPFTCDQCEKCFARKDKLKIHQKVHSGESSVPSEILFSCDQCEKCFTRKDKLKSHQKVHSGESSTPSDIQFSCDKCGEDFLNKNKLEKHLKICGSSTETEGTQIKFNCNLCSEGFYEKQLMIAHLKDHQKYGEQIDQQMEA